MTKETQRIPIPEQDEVLKIEDKNMIVSASAGSGKTTIMIEKILKYLTSNKCHANELLVLTYTKAAASEMKKKLVDKIKKESINNECLLDELDYIADSDISTFDSFCQKLIKKYFYILDIDPSFDILEGGDKSYYQGVSLNQSIKEFKQTNPSLYENLLNTFSSKRDENEIKEIIITIYEYCTSLLSLDDFINKSAQFYDKNLNIAESYLNSYYSAIINQIKINLISLFGRCKNYGFDSYCEYINNLLSICDKFLCENNFANKIDFLQNVNYKTLKHLDNDELFINQQIAKEKTKLKTTVDKLTECFISQETIEKSYDECLTLFNSTIILLKLFIKKYTQLKKSINSFDFNDVERLTISLLENKIVQSEIKNNYKYIFVDEFQDANAVQEKIIRLLENNNLFFVGDTKQSIYAFRQSDPEIFLNIENEFLNNPNSESKTLNSNFRTSSHILNFINEIFSVIMTKETSNIDYLNTSKFVPRAVYEDLDNEVSVDIHLLNKQDKPDKIKPLTVYDLKHSDNLGLQENQSKNEYYLVCQKIIELLGTQIYDKDLKNTRPLTYSDFTILLAKRGNYMQILTEVLTEVGIPYSANLADDLNECYDNLVLFNLLKYCHNSNDDYSLYSILTSCLFNFSNNELTIIKSTFKQTDYFYESFNLYKNLNDDIALKINNFIKLIENTKFNIKHKGIFYSLNDILIKTNYLLSIAAETNFETRKNNIEEFINLFSNSKYNFDLPAYIIYRETTIGKEKIEKSNNAINSVQITTMHSSKGLEYPVVILPHLDDDFYKQPQTSAIKINKEYGLGIKAYNYDDRTESNGIFYECCKIKNRTIEQSEKIRLLYVAMTRAKNQLILTGYNTKNFYKFKDSFEIMSTTNYLSLIINSLSENVIDKINNDENFICNLYNSQKLKLRVDSLVKEISPNTLTLVDHTKNEDEVKKLSEYLAQDISYQKSNIALKNSVSGLSYDENSNINFAPKNLNISEHLNEKADELGTLYHKLLELIHFNNINSKEDVRQFIECNFNQGEINIFNNLSYDNIYKNINVIKGLIQNNTYLLKEQKFVMQLPYNEIVNSNIIDKILVQGVIDLLAIKNNEVILIDYKLSKGSTDYIKNHYSRQLQLYEKAISKEFSNYKIKKYILNLYTSEIINLN